MSTTMATVTYELPSIMLETRDDFLVLGIAEDSATFRVVRRPYCHSSTDSIWSWHTREFPVARGPGLIDVSTILYLCVENTEFDKLVKSVQSLIAGVFAGEMYDNELAQRLIHAEDVFSAFFYELPYETGKSVLDGSVKVVSEITHVYDDAKAWITRDTTRGNIVDYLRRVRHTCPSGIILTGDATDTLVALRDALWLD